MKMQLTPAQANRLDDIEFPCTSEILNVLDKFARELYGQENVFVSDDAVGEVITTMRHVLTHHVRDK